MKAVFDSKAIVVAALALAWGSALFGPVLLMAVPTWIALIAFLVGDKRWRRLAVLLCCSPAVVVSIAASVSFFRGTARFLTVGLPDPELYNVDPTTRLQTVSSGCIVTGGEIVWQVPNNVTLRILAGLMSMPGAYLGPYPSRDEAERALGGANQLPVSDLGTDVVRVGGRSVRLRNQLGQELLHALDANHASSARVAIWRDSVLVLDLGTRPSLASEEAALPRMLAIVDARTGKVVAYYGTGFGLRLPRQWT